MIDWMIARRLIEAFPASFINRNGEFVVSRMWKLHINLDGCNEREVQCRVLEDLGHAAAAHQPYRTDAANRRYNAHVREGINKFLGTQFSRGDMMLINEHLCRTKDRALTLRFIESGYNMDVLRAR